MSNRPTEKVLSLLQERLETFELKFEADAVATTNDGSTVMQNFGKLSPTIQQLGHLAVTKVFYIKKLNNETSKTSSSGCQYDAESEYEKDESNDSDSDNVDTADQYNLQGDVSPAIIWIKNCLHILQ